MLGGRRLLGVLGIASRAGGSLALLLRLDAVGLAGLDRVAVLVEVGAEVVDEVADRLAELLLVGLLELAGLFDPLQQVGVLAVQAGPQVGEELADAIDAAKISGTWNLVSLSIGVNNQYRGRLPEQFRGEFRELLATAIRFAGRKARRVIVLSIPDWSVMPHGETSDRPRVAREIDAYNAVKKAEAEKAGAAWIDVTPTSRSMKNDGTAPDGLHPSAKQYSAWAQLALQPARAALNG